MRCDLRQKDLILGFATMLALCGCGNDVPVPVPEGFDLISPADGAMGVPPFPTFDWQDSAYADSYSLQVDDDPVFGSPIVDVISDNSNYATVDALVANVMYYWRVTAINLSGSTQATGRSFTTSPFADIGVGLTGVDDCSLAWGDYDNDGDLDLGLLGFSGSGPVSRIYRNDAGVFTDITAGLTGVQSGALAWGDYDNDGDLDLALAGYDGSVFVSTIYRNDAGVFIDINAGLQGVTMCALAWGDYDNDGDLDLALSGYDNSGRISTIYRNETGTFVDIEAGLLEVSSSSLAWGDYDNDGDLDLALAGYDGSDPVSSIYRNNAGVFVDINASLTGVSSCSLAWGDYDCDGDLDLALAGDGGPIGLSRIYRNDSGVFTDINAGLRFASSCSLAWGDYDNDGDLDLALAGSGASIIYRNDAGTFTDASAGLEDLWGCSLDLGDYDNDGDLDLVVAGSDSHGDNVIFVYRNDDDTPNTVPAAPTGLSTVVNGCDVAFSWIAATDTETPSPGLSYNLRVGTAPGLADVCSGMADSSSGLRLLAATGDAQASSWTIENLAGGTYYWSVQAIDTALSGSAWATEQSVDVTGPCIQMLLPDDGERMAVGSAATIRWVSAGVTNVRIEFSHDGGATWEDIVASMAAVTGTYQWTVAGSPSNDCVLRVSDASAPATADTVSGIRVPHFVDIAEDFVRAYAAAWGDYDNDGDLDLVLTANVNVGYVHSSYVYENHNGTFVIADWFKGLSSSSVVWGDYDNDGDLDLAVAGRDYQYNCASMILRNDNGSFTDIGAGLTNVWLCDLAWGDYDNDGDLDLALAGYTQSFGRTSKIYRNDAGVFTDISAGLTALSGCSLAWGDYDNDGDLDLALAGFNGGSGISMIYENDAGTFTDIGAGLAGVSSCSLAWGDYDSDGDLDLALAGSYETKIYQNDAGAFTDTSAGLTGVDFCSLAWGDYDNDGDLDLAVIGYDGSDPVSSIYENDAGVFTDIDAGLVGVWNGTVAWGDYDGDHDLDLIMVGAKKVGYTNLIYRNDAFESSATPSAPTGLGTSYTGTGPYDVTFTWSAPAVADETPDDGLSYNLRVGTTSGGNEIFSGHADAASGKRRIPARGIVQPGASWNEWTLTLPAGTYYWSVQAVDTAFAGGAWAAEETLVVP